MVVKIKEDASELHCRTGEESTCDAALKFPQ